jgi:N5-(cytidine 5'-diphosphoramidyl)-L-glutamine hydrolase
MKTIAITQRVATDPRYKERHDCLDQAWIRFVLGCGLMPVPVPNTTEAARALCQKVTVDGIVLTGGNDLAVLGGDAPERDTAESALLDLAEKRRLPVLGVCRGMQVLQHRLGISLTRVSGHVAPRQVIRIDGRSVEVNSYHNFGTVENRAPFEVWAVAEDGVIKAIRDPRRRVVGIMWHPERLDPFASRDRDMFRNLFATN